MSDEMKSWETVVSRIGPRISSWFAYGDSPNRREAAVIIREEVLKEFPNCEDCIRSVPSFRHVPGAETTCQPSEHMAADMSEKRARANVLAKASREAEVAQNHGQVAQSSQTLEDVTPEAEFSSETNNSSANMIPPAVQAALDAYDAEVAIGSFVPHGEAMQAALDAAFPIMLREVAEEMCYLEDMTILESIADSYGKP